MFLQPTQFRGPVQRLASPPTPPHKPDPKDGFSPRHSWGDALQAVGSGLLVGASIAGPALLSRGVNPAVGVAGGLLGNGMLVAFTSRGGTDDSNGGFEVLGMAAIGLVSGVAGAAGWAGAAIAVAAGAAAGIHHGVQVWRGQDEPLIGPR